MKRQSKLFEFFSKDNLQDSEDELEDPSQIIETKPSPVKKRGAPRIPLSWTRVVKITSNTL